MIASEIGAHVLTFAEWVRDVTGAHPAYWIALALVAALVAA
jgi:hypothetical protein